MNECLMERIVDNLVGIAVLLVGFSLLALGVTFFPVLGIIAAIPLIWFSISLFRSPPGKACELPEEEYS